MQKQKRHFITKRQESTEPRRLILNNIRRASRDGLFLLSDETYNQPSPVHSVFHEKNRWCCCVLAVYSSLSNQLAQFQRSCFGHFSVVSLITTDMREDRRDWSTYLSFVNKHSTHPLVLVSDISALRSVCSFGCPAEKLGAATRFLGTSSLCGQEAEAKEGSSATRTKIKETHNQSMFI